MFAELDRVDIAYEDEAGRRVAVQTDHRSPAEIAADRERSVAFAVFRVLAARGFDRVVYAFEAEPPDFLRQAVEAAGGRIQVEATELEPVHPVDPEATDERVRSCLDTLGRAALDRRGLPPDRASLEAVERELLRDRSAIGADPERLATAWIELAGAAGVVTRALHGGTWTREDAFEELVPYGFLVDARSSNVLGRARRLLTEGLCPGPAALLAVLEEPLQDDGAVLPVIRPAGFGGENIGRSRALIHPEPEGVDALPRVFLIRDRPSSVEYLSTDSDEDFAGLLEASLHNLSRISVEAQRLEDAPCFLVEGDFYAASKVLDRSFLRGLAEALDTEQLLIAVPARSGAVIAAPTNPLGLMSVVESLYAGAPESQRVSPLVFVATPEHGICGLVRRSTPPLARAWWKRLWGPRS